MTSVSRRSSPSELSENIRGRQLLTRSQMLLSTNPTLTRRKSQDAEGDGCHGASHPPGHGRVLQFVHAGLCSPVFMSPAYHEEQDSTNLEYVWSASPLSEDE